MSNKLITARKGYKKPIRDRSIYIGENIFDITGPMDRSSSSVATTSNFGYNTTFNSNPFSLNNTYFNNNVGYNGNLNFGNTSWNYNNNSLNWNLNNTDNNNSNFWSFENLSNSIGNSNIWNNIGKNMFSNITKDYTNKVSKYTENVNKAKAALGKAKGVEGAAKGASGSANIGSVASGIGSAVLNTPVGEWALDHLDPLWNLAGKNRSKAGGYVGTAGKTVFKAGVGMGNPYVMAAGAIIKGVGDVIDLGWGYNIENEGNVRSNTDRLANLDLTSNSLDELQGKAAHIGRRNIGEVSNGFATNRGTEKAEEIQDEQNQKYGFSRRWVDNIVRNIGRKKYADYMYNGENNFPRGAAFGGQLDIKDKDAIITDDHISILNNRFDMGGNKKKYRTTTKDKGGTTTEVYVPSGYIAETITNEGDTIYKKPSDSWWNPFERVSARRASNGPATPDYRRLQQEYKEAYDNSVESGNVGLDRIKDYLNNLLGTSFDYGGSIGFSNNIDPSTAIGYLLYTDKYIKDNNKNNNEGITSIFAGAPGSMFALGGLSQTHGGTFNNTTHVNTGGTHEENINDGVQLGTDREGIPNLVEEGEVIWNDYVFSNRLTVPKRYHKYAKGGKLNKETKDLIPYEVKVLKPFEGMSFADAAKKAEKMTGADERTEDPIALRGLANNNTDESGLLTNGPQGILNVLKMVQEKERELERLRLLQEEILNMTPEEFAALQLQMQMMQQAQELQAAGEEALAMLAELQAMQPLMTEEEMLAQQSQPSPEEIALMQQMQQAAPVITALGGQLDRNNRYDFGGDLNAFKKELEKRGISIDDYRDYVLSLYNDLLERLAASDLYASNPNAFLDKLNQNFDKKIAGDFIDALDLEVNYGPIANVIKHSGKTAKEWNALSERQLDRLIKQYRASLKGRDTKAAFDNLLKAFNTQLEIKGKIDAYLKQQRNSILNADDLKGLTLEQLTMLSKHIDPSYTPADFSKMSEKELREAVQGLKDRIVLKAKDNKITIGSINDAFAAPTMHETWKPVNADDAWKKTPVGYDWENPIYGGDHSVEASIEGKYKPRSWKKDGNIIVDGKPYKDMKEYELSDEYLRPRYELAKSAASTKEGGNDLWNTYVSGLNPNYKNSYAPTTVFGKDYANYLYTDDKEDYDKFKKYITDNYGNLRDSGFFDLKAGLMHGIYKPIEEQNRDLYQIRGKEGRYLAPEGEWQKYYSEEINKGDDGTTYHTLTPNAAINIARDKGIPNDIVLNEDGTYSYRSDINDPFPKASTWPYLAGLGLLGAGLLYNILRPKDYSNADALIKAGALAGSYMPISFNPIGNYLKYTPEDPWFYTSPVMAQSNATNRMVNNRVSPSNNAATLANTYNTMVALGLGTRQQLDSNFNKYAKVGEYNKDTNKFNSEGFLKADMANQDANSRARYMNFEGLKAGYAMKQAIDDANANAINAGLNGLANLAFTYAQQKDYNNLLRWRANQAVDGPGIYFEEDRDRQKPYVTAKKGGKLKRKKKGLSF